MHTHNLFRIALNSARILLLPTARTMSTASAASAATRKRLIALDFDDTIAAQNTDLVARDLLDPSAITEAHRRLYTENGWTDYMQAIFGTLHEHRFTAATIRRAIRAIPEVPGMVRLIGDLVREHNFDAIIISDSNSEFIEQWNEENELTDKFVEVFTNPARFDEATTTAGDDGRMLRIRPYHHQTECTLSTANLCKGRVLEEFLQRRLLNAVTYEHVFYVGDGRNDVCPVLRLSAVDYGCARRGMRLEKDLVRRQATEDKALQCGVIGWSDGDELRTEILKQISTDRVGEFVVDVAAKTRKESMAKWTMD